jgi:hypothetical protein
LVILILLLISSLECLLPFILREARNCALVVPLRKLWHKSKASLQPLIPFHPPHSRRFAHYRITMLHPEFPIVGFLSAALVLISLPRQIRAGNIACIALIFWLFHHCVVAGINAIIWAGNVNNTAPIWCDISKKFMPLVLVCLYLHTTHSNLSK